MTLHLPPSSSFRLPFLPSTRSSGKEEEESGTNTEQWGSSARAITGGVNGAGGYVLYVNGSPVSGKAQPSSYDNASSILARVVVGGVVTFLSGKRADLGEERKRRE